MKWRGFWNSKLQKLENAQGDEFFKGKIHFLDTFCSSIKPLIKTCLGFSNTSTPRKFDKHRTDLNALFSARLIRPWHSILYPWVFLWSWQNIINEACCQVKSAFNSFLKAAFKGEMVVLRKPIPSASENIERKEKLWLTLNTKRP